MNMQKWANGLLSKKTKQPMPILSFPSIQLFDIGVDELIASSELQAKGMKKIAECTDAGASFSMMDLSIEAEAFGAQVRFSKDDIPTIISEVVKSKEDADQLVVPDISQGRLGIYIDAMGLACKEITDRPVFAGVIGPFSLAGRLMGVSESMINCYVDPEMVHATLEKATQFIIEYTKAYQAAGANGVVLAEPLAGMLSPALCEEFATPYVKKYVDAIQQDDFAVVYHNCGDNLLDLMDSILKCGAMAYHFGNAVDMKKIMDLMPSDTITMGNLDPAGQLKNGTPESIRKATLELMEQCSKYDNFVVSTGCDIPPLTSWKNIDAFFNTVKEYYHMETQS